MKTTDSVMRESEIELLEKTVEDIMVESSCEPDGERLWVKTSYELADLCRPIISHSLAEARRELVEEMRGKVNLIEVMSEARYLTDSGFWATKKLVAKDDVLNLLTGDNPERKV